MITVSNLVYEYPGKRALDNVSFSLEPKTITALVGPNGAGKTTLLRCLAALTPPFSGKVTIDNWDSDTHPREIHQISCYLSDFYGLYDELTVKQALTYMAWVHEIPYSEVDTKVMKAAERLQIAEFLNVEIGKLSRGLRQRLAIAQTIVHEPQILFLDEPSAGLDPEARYHLSKLFVDLQKGGMTLIISSHILAELEDYCTQMLVIRDGKLVIHRALDETTMEFKISLSEPAAPFIEKLSAIQNVILLKHSMNDIWVIYQGEKNLQPQLLKSLISNQIPVCEITLVKQRLQEAYMETVHPEGEQR